jgi:hypothetical protein
MDVEGEIDIDVDNTTEKILGFEYTGICNYTSHIVWDFE